MKQRIGDALSKQRKHGHKQLREKQCQTGFGQEASEFLPRIGQLLSQLRTSCASSKNGQDLEANFVQNVSADQPHYAAQAADRLALLFDRLFGNKHLLEGDQDRKNPLSEEDAQLKGSTLVFLKHLSQTFQTVFCASARSADVQS